MPTYVYGCDDCKEREQVVHRMLEVVNVFCPRCQRPMRRIPQMFNYAIRVMEPGLRNTIEIHHFNKEKYDANKARREANIANQRHREEARNAGRRIDPD